MLFKQKYTKFFLILGGVIFLQRVTFFLQQVSFFLHTSVRIIHILIYFDGNHIRIVSSCSNSVKTHNVSYIP